MAKLAEIVAAIYDARLFCGLWIDGSFLTAKIDPPDVDIVLHVRAEDGFDPANADHIRLVTWLQQNLKESHLCDSYVNLVPPSGHPFHLQAAGHVAYWHKQFGYSRATMNKGIAVIRIADNP